jgi:HK97 gp10 family phage protein
MGDLSLTEQSRRLAKRLAAIPAEIIRTTQPVLVSCANDLARVAKALAPKDTGALVESIVVTAPNQALATVGNPTQRHGHLQEFGTVKQAAQPFLRPAERLTHEKN